MINSKIVECVDEALDRKVAETYQKQPLAQDWARVSKVAEELGEAIQQLIAITGQNPRKGQSGSYGELLEELADTAMTAVYAIQHYTKDVVKTETILTEAQFRHHSRLCDA
jgi:hypothetical protein